MPSRRVTVLDAMILVAATAVGLAAIREFSPGYYTWPYSPIPPTTWIDRAVTTASNWAFYTSPLPAAWSVAALVLRVRPPRPPWRCLMRQPGAIASVAAAPTIGLGVVHCALDYALHSNSWHSAAFEFTTYALGCAVAAAWLILALSGRWRAEASWIDRLGRLLGVYWILGLPLMGLRG